MLFSSKTTSFEHCLCDHNHGHSPKQLEISPICEVIIYEIKYYDLTELSSEGGRFFTNTMVKPLK